ncbi:MAG TPA: NADH-quinone oxidoreductase subunit L [Pyrinomonadaceae bacterium]|nr:NADH-quinone oxidoreductase subunit L [Pyrinomonadaceae bacterium]
MHRYIWLVPILPLLGAAINGLLGRKFRFSERVVAAVGVGSVALAFLISVAAVISYGTGVWPKPYVTTDMVYTWIPGGATELTEGLAERAQLEGERLMHAEAERKAIERGAKPGERVAVLVGMPNVPEKRGQGSLLDVEWSYQLDALSSVFMLVVTGVGLCIFIFATGYMHGDAGFYRFFAYLGLFMFSMLILVMGSNFMMMFVGWEGVGLCSYLLIGYYFDRKEAGDASRKAFITNRIGDFGFALAVFAVIATFGSTQYSTVMEAARTFPVEVLGHWGIMSWIALGLFIGACGKSAQIPLYVWLPDAMAGPTPVSALIHAATMVTAGLYMLARTNVIFQHSQTMMTVVAIVGALTALFAATIGITQNDIKKVLAYSTVSQLGFMFLACGVGAFTIGIFHVMTHAFFKALMFLGAGSVIHAMHHEQDMRRMGGLKKYMPKTYWTFFAGWLAICGIIPFAGFWSKDEILWNAASTRHVPGGWLLWLIATIAATCTAFYMTRLMAMTFWGKERFLEVRAGGQADEAHAQAYDEGKSIHVAVDPSVADRPHHGPEESVGVAHVLQTEALGQGEATDERGHDIHDKHDPGAHGAHGHGDAHGSVTPHESPPSMWVPLAVLAVLATIGGLVGVGPAFKFITGSEHPGGRLNIVNWLDPVIWNPSTRQFGSETHAETGGATSPASHGATGETASAQGEHAATPVARDEHGATQATHGGDEHAEAPLPYSDTGYNMAGTVARTFGSHAASEWFFIIVSLVVAGFGIFLGFLFYVWRPHLPDLWAGRLSTLYHASFNKYWVDELYGALVTRRTMDAARGVYAADSKGIDGAVNGTAWLTRRLSSLTGNFDRLVVDGAVNGIAGFIKLLMSPLLRAAQTGLTANYALVMILGLIFAVGLYFGKDIFAAITGGR